MSLLHVEQHGPADAPPLLLIHGWGLHGGVWAPVIEPLARKHRLYVVDLPGHGHSRLPAGGFDLPRLSQWLLDSVPEGAVWIGWSLGGMAALQTALNRPQALAGLIMVAAQPQFIQSEDWPHATPGTTLAAFAQSLQTSPEMTLKRFLGLQVRGTDDEKALLRRIREMVDQRPLPQAEALRLGLEILRSANLRPELKRLTTPTQVILGERDMLVPVATHERMRPLMPGAEFHIMPQAGHAPFLSHSREFLTLVETFLKD